ncbi:MAG: hypothetical protein ACLT5C_05680 [Blautia hansenii]
MAQILQAYPVWRRNTVTVTLSDGTVKEGSVEVSGAHCTVTFSDDGVAVDDTVTAAKADGTKIGTEGVHS